MLFYGTFYFPLEVWINYLCNPWRNSIVQRVSMNYWCSLCVAGFRGGPPRGGPRGAPRGQSARGRGGHRESLKFEGEFDFDASNAQFDKEEIERELKQKLTLGRLFSLFFCMFTDTTLVFHTRSLFLSWWFGRIWTKLTTWCVPKLFTQSRICIFLLKGAFSMHCKVKGAYLNESGTYSYLVIKQWSVGQIRCKSSLVEDWCIILIQTWKFHKV